MAKQSSLHTEITYEELGDYIGRKATILVSSEWWEVIRGTIEAKKKCSKCENFLPLSCFNNDKRRQFGKRSQCKSCYKEGASSENKNIALDNSDNGSYAKDVEPKIEYTITHFDK